MGKYTSVFQMIVLRLIGFSRCSKWHSQDRENSQFTSMHMLHFSILNGWMDHFNLKKWYIFLPCDGMIGKIRPKDGHVLIPGICKDVTIYLKRDLQIWLRVFRWRDHLRLSGRADYNYRIPYNGKRRQESLSQKRKCEREVEVRVWLLEGGHQPRSAGSF